jgi:galactose oxidase
VRLGRVNARFTLPSWGLISSLFVSACRDSPDHGSAPPADGPGTANVEDDSDQPIRFSYVCGNRFVVRSTYSVPISVAWRVIGTTEDGSATLAAAPTDDPAFSEELIDTRTRGSVELSFEGRKLRTRANGNIPCTPSLSTATFAGAALSQTGSWGAPFYWPTVAVHLHLMPSGKVLSWGGATRIPQIWDPATGAFTAYPSPIPLFCTGHAFTPDGRLAVFGGHIKMEHGLPNITLFSSAGGWSNSTPMRQGRWYPTATTMATGEIVTISGKDKDGVIVPVPEVWKNGVVRRLTSAALSLPYYPIAFLEPRAGRLFYAGEERMSRFLDITGTGKWTDAGLRRFGVRDYGSAVMYDVGKILYAGGGRTTATAEIIDLNKATPKWELTGSMAYARRHLNTTVLPTGEVLVTSGTAGTVFNDLTKIVQAAELWDPATGAWTTLPSAQIPRAYHSTALLLPDARVLVSGGGDGGQSAIQKNAELFSPPYLFRGARPRISSAPTVIRYNEAFRVATPDAGSIARISLIRIGSVTHGIDMNARSQALGFTADASGLTVAPIIGRKRTPPGHYMLFILNGARVPSVAKIVQLK